MARKGLNSAKKRDVNELGQMESQNGEQVPFKIVAFFFFYFLEKAAAVDRFRVYNGEPVP